MYQHINSALYGPQPLLVCDSADFDGANDYMTRGGALTGSADGKSGILSFWIRFDGTTTEQRIFGNTSGGTLFFTVSRVTSDSIIQIIGRNAAGVTILDLPTSSTFAASATWYHILASWDLSNTVGHLYVNDVSDVGSTTLTDDTINYANVSEGWHIGANNSGNLKVDGCLAEFYFAMNQYLDLSSVYERRKFISANGKPVFLGGDGSSPTGTAPIVYQRVADGAAVATFATNLGTGGDFSITGTLETGSTSPSDF